MINVTLRPLYVWEKEPLLVVHEAEGRSELLWINQKNLVLTRSEPRTDQALASRYTLLRLPAGLILTLLLIFPTCALVYDVVLSFRISHQLFIDFSFLASIHVPRFHTQRPDNPDLWLEIYNMKILIE